MLVHGWGCDHGTLHDSRSFSKALHGTQRRPAGAPQKRSSRADFFVAQFADDVAWLCEEQGIEGASIVGHSMGGTVALELGLAHPYLVQAVAMIDTAFQAPVSVEQTLNKFIPQLAQADYAKAYRSIMRALSLSSEQPALDGLLEGFPLAPHKYKDDCYGDCSHGMARNSSGSVGLQERSSRCYRSILANRPLPARDAFGGHCCGYVKVPW